MKIRFAAIVTILIGFLVLLGYFFPAMGFDKLQQRMLDIAIVLAGVGMLIGIWNLLKTHWYRLGWTAQKKDPSGQRRKRDANSAFVIFGFAVTFLAGLWFTPSDPNYLEAVFTVQSAVEISLLAILSVSLLIFAFLFFKDRQDLLGIVFILSSLLFLLLGSGMLHMLPSGGWLGDIITMLNELPLAGARGILLGVALGGIVTGLRVIVGIDRPYEE
ncbi:MAG: hypothetical protein JW750_05240 [Anaerolineaceae bacterium]|nr:hypothetical protein [Anaerolineaceae bacterium]